MAKILLDIYPAKGHYHATLKMASMLNEKGHAVIYGTTLDYNRIIEQFGFESVVWEPLLVIPLKMRRLERKGFYSFSGLIDATAEKSLIKAREKFVLFKSSINRLNPDLVLLDEQNVYKSIFYKILGINVLLFQTKPDIHYIKGIPPITSFFIPNFKKFSTFYCDLLWTTGIIGHTFVDFLQKCIYLNQNDIDIYRKLSKEYLSNHLNKIDHNKFFRQEVKRISRIIISPKAFDFPHAEKNNVFRIGPLIDIKREGQIQNPRYQSLLRKINLVKGQGLIIYCSMGTVSGNDLKRTLLFFKKIIKVALKNRDDFYVLSTGKYLDINQLLPLPNNVFVFEQLPQVDLLQYCDLMITHGGMNSINECVYNEVPMLIYPLSLKWDQPGNSARAVYHGLGLRGKIKRDSANTISKKVNQIRSDYEIYKANVRKMKIKFDEQNNSKEAVGIIESFIKPQN